MLPLHIHSVDDLITSREATREGFLQQALTKTQRAAPYIKEARNLKSILDTTDNIAELAQQSSQPIRHALLAAAGFSDKARGRMTGNELTSALEAILIRIAEMAPDDWREEIVYRFLLTRGDTLGGSMRNITGAAGSVQLSHAVIAALDKINFDHRITRTPRNSEKIVALEWQNRLMVFDRKPRFIDNNIDVIFLDTSQMLSGTVTLEQPWTYLACGELKGGIDPAGADEHWKTARSAFQRICDKFSDMGLPEPALFFVGAAIERNMAEEIFKQLQDDRLTYAARISQFPTDKGSCQLAGSALNERDYPLRQT